MRCQSNLRLLWFCFDTLCDQSTKLTLLSPPKTGDTKSYRDLFARVFPRLARLNVFALNSDWLITLVTSLGWAKVGTFGLGLTTLN